MAAREEWLEIVVVQFKGVSLFALENFVLEVGLSVSANLVLLAEVDLIGFLFFLALEGRSKFSASHFVLMAVSWVHSVVKSWGELILDVLIKFILLLQSHVFVLVVSSQFLVQTVELVLLSASCLSFPTIKTKKRRLEALQTYACLVAL